MRCRVIMPPMVELMRNALCVSVYLSLSPQPPYSHRIDECAELICFNGELLLHNSSLHCRYNTTQPQCSLLGLPILINTDPCCPQWQCPCMFLPQNYCRLQGFVTMTGGWLIIPDTFPRSLYRDVRPASNHLRWQQRGVVRQWLLHPGQPAQRDDNWHRGEMSNQPGNKMRINTVT